MNRYIIFSLLTALTFLPAAHSQEKDLANLPPHLTPVPYAGIRNYHLTQNLGPTGARGWIEGNNGHSNARDRRCNRHLKCHNSVTLAP